MCRWSLHCFLAVAVTLITGCGGDNEGADTAAPAATETPAAANPADASEADTPTVVSHAPTPEVATPKVVNSETEATNPRGNSSALKAPGSVVSSPVELTPKPARASSASSKELSPDSSSWSNEDLVTAVRRRNGLLPDEITRRALKMSDAEYVRLVRQLLEAGLEDPESPAKSPPADRPSVPAASKKEQRVFSFDGPLVTGAPAAQRNPKPIDSGTPGAAQLSELALTRAVLEGLLINDSNDAWKTIEAVVNRELKTPIEERRIPSLLFETAFGLRRVSPVMLESTARSNLNQAEGTASMLSALTSLATHVLRRELYLPTNDSDNVDRLPSARLPVVNPRPPTIVGFGEVSDQKQAETAPNATEKPHAAGTSNIPIPSYSNRAVGDMIRGQDIVQRVLELLSTAGPSAEDVPLLRFAATLPRVSTRHAIYNVYQDSFAIGPGSILKTGVFDGSVRDPGQLVVLKSLPRKAPRRSRRKSDTPEVSQAVRDSWTTAVWQVANALRHQLREVSRDSRVEFSGSIPIRLHPGVEPDVTMQLTLDDESTSTDGAPLNTQVYYTRATFQPKGKSDLTSITKHYTSKTKGTRRERQEEGVLWFDGFRGRDGKCSSLDVMIQRAEGALAPADGTAGTSYVVEAFAVVMTDPRLNPNLSRQSE